jgi:hypothetical protein
MTKIYNSPPNWPTPPPGWMPEPGWDPDPAWGPAPPGWQFWVEPPESSGSPYSVPAAGLQTTPLMGTPSSAGSHELRVFLSYRRTDCQAQANGLYDGLRNRLPEARVFMDIDGIPAGVDFEEYIKREISVCDLVLVLIGDNWLDARPGSDIRRIDEEEDFVRLEIESALASPQVRTLPVLVENAQMPRSADLPDTIARLARFNAIELSDMRWRSDLDRLVDVVEDIGRQLGKIAPAPGPAPQTGAAEPPRPVPRTDPRATPRTPGMAYFLMVVPLLTLGLGAWVPALWAGLKRGVGDPARNRLFLVAVVLGAAAVAGAVFPDGIGGALLLLAIVAGTTVAVAFRKLPAP